MSTKQISNILVWNNSNMQVRLYCTACHCYLPAEKKLKKKQFYSHFLGKKRQGKKEEQKKQVYCHFLKASWNLSTVASVVCWRVLTYADVCWRLLTSADASWRKLTQADACWRMLTHADACWRMLTHADACWRMLSIRQHKYADKSSPIFWKHLSNLGAWGPLPHKRRGLVSSIEV
jgi:hypothetical protein